MTTLKRPGIMPKTLNNNAITEVDTTVAYKLTGMKKHGIIIPYNNLHGDPVADGGTAFHRLRLYEPIGKRKYHQRASSKVHAYFPHGMVNQLENDSSIIVIVEGEFKAISLVEEGIPSIGISGFYGFQEDDSFLPEIKDILETYKPSEIYFLGDADTALNFQFSDAALKMRRLLPSETVLKLPRLDYNGPKGIDDLKEAKIQEHTDYNFGKNTFRMVWQEMQNNAPKIDKNTDREEICMTLLNLSRESIKEVTGENRNKTLKRIARMCNSLGTLHRLEFEKIASEMGLNKTQFKSLVKEQLVETASEQERTKIDLSMYLFLSSNNVFYTRESDGKWLKRNEKNLERNLVKKGFSRSKKRESGMSEVEDTIEYIQSNNAIDHVGELAGYKKGVHSLGNQKILIQNGLCLVKPKHGDWSLIREFIKGILCYPDDNQIQIELFFGWLLNFSTCLENERRICGQAVIFAGPEGCGKSLFQKFITEFVGSRSAQPFSYMLGKTEFNDDLAQAEHLYFDDEIPLANRRDISQLASAVKRFSSNSSLRVHRKHSPAFSVDLTQRLTISVNDRDKSLMAVPKIDKDLENKVIVFKCHKKPFPMKTDTPDEKNHFFDKLVSQIPAFKHYLHNEFELPKEYKSERYGVISHQDPSIIRLLNKSSDDGLLDHLECILGKLNPINDTYKEFTSNELLDLMKESKSDCWEEAKRQFGFDNDNERNIKILIKKMSFVKESNPELIGYGRRSTKRFWKLNLSQ
jgi:hypothetical protein